MTTLLIATHNAHKVTEIKSILGAQIQFFTLNDFPNAPKVIEDAETFSGNASKKAVELARWISENSKLKIQNSRLDFILADDSGLEVDALDDAPGVHSARFAALDKNENASDADNNDKLLRLLKNVSAEKRTARFRCVLAVVKIDEALKISRPGFFDGACGGKIIFTPRGENGFGYDPLFVPDGFEKTFAEFGEAKNKLSHRAKALAKLKTWLNDQSATRTR
jgi:XTP/dITP diphosphohydrolase